MLLSQRSIVFICVAFLALQQLTTGLICYECAPCDSVNSNTPTTNITNGACFKLVTTTAGVSAVGRGGVIDCVAGTVSIGANSVSTYCCTTDRCNTGIALSNSFGLAIVTVTISVVLRAMIIG